jgi:hypothetical protein
MSNATIDDALNIYPTAPPPPTDDTFTDDGCIVDEIEGDLFMSADSLCHCVSEDLHMGKVR